jgi:hypothetical protein
MVFFQVIADIQSDSQLFKLNLSFLLLRLWSWVQLKVLGCLQGSPINKASKKPRWPTDPVEIGWQGQVGDVWLGVPSEIRHGDQWASKEESSFLFHFAMHWKTWGTTYLKCSHNTTPLIMLFSWLNGHRRSSRLHELNISPSLPEALPEGLTSELQLWHEPISSFGGAEPFLPITLIIYVFYGWLAGILPSSWYFLSPPVPYLHPPFIFKNT